MKKNICSNKKVINHLHRLSGQIKGVEKMYLQKRECLDLLQQIVALRASLAKLALLILEEEIQGCLQSKLRPEDRFNKINKILEQLFKYQA